MAREHEISAQPWGTLEELLLACAVNRHSTENWDSIALELQNRRISSSSSSSTVPSFTPQLCEKKFFDLKRRFISSNDAGSSSNLVDQLRRIRVEELRREVQQREVSIESLKLKVKTLVEEREMSLKEEADRDDRQNKLWPEVVSGERIVGDYSGDYSGDLDNRSVNESNSTSQKPEATTTTIIIKDEQNDVGEATGEKKAQVKTEPVEPEAENETIPVRTGKGLGNERVNGEERDNKRQMSGVQSLMSLSKKKRCRSSSSSSSRGASSSGEECEREVSLAKTRASAVKPESLLRILGIIRTHRLGSAFDLRQQSQETERYKSLIRQHMDLQRIQRRLDKGVYSECTAKFFRDLLLLFNNIIVFYPKHCLENIAAQELWALVLKEMMHKLRNQLPQPVTNLKSKTEKPPVSVSKLHKSSTIVACGKHRSIKALTKNATGREDKKVREVEERAKAKEKKVDSSSFVGIDDKSGIRKKRSKERPVSGRRNSLSKKSGEIKHQYGGNELSSHDAMELKFDEKENVGRKKGGAASFLKRMKQTSESGVTKKDDENAEDRDCDGKEKGKGRKRDVKRVTRSSGGREEMEESGRVKRGVGRLPKRAAAESTGKRRRNNVENEVEVGGIGKARKRSRK